MTTINLEKLGQAVKWYENERDSSWYLGSDTIDLLALSAKAYLEEHKTLVDKYKEISGKVEVLLKKGFSTLTFFEQEELEQLTQQMRPLDDILYPIPLKQES